MAAVSVVTENDNNAFCGGLLQDHYLLDNGIFASVCFVDNDGVISVAVERCALCGGTRKPFVCKKCVCDGNFTHSLSVDKERYAEKKERWERVKQDRLTVLTACEKKIASKLAVDAKRSEIRKLKQKVRLFQKAVHAAKTEVANDKGVLATLRHDNDERVKRGVRQQEKLRYIVRYIDKLLAKTSESREDLRQRHLDLQLVRKKHISDLIASIFPVTEDTDLGYHGNETIDKHYRVVASLLPVYDTLTAYSQWLVQSPQRTAMSPAHAQPHSVGDGVAAALAYVTQLLAVMASILDIHLCHRLIYSDLYNTKYSRDQFDHVLVKLHRNIVQLCFSQNVPATQLSHTDMLQNLLETIYAPELGRCGAFEVVSLAGDEAEEDYDVPLLEQSMYDEGGWGEGGWEHVPLGLPDIESPRGSVTSSLSSPGPTDTSVPAAGFMSSVTSLWRTGFWRKTSSPDQ